jgi:putative hemolysin
MEDSITDNKAIQIDIESIIRTKSPKTAKSLPMFIIRYLKRVLHQDEINKFLFEKRNRFGIDFVNDVITLFDIKHISIGVEKIPPDKNYLFVSNHPQGAIDSMCFIANVYSHFGDVRFMVNDILLNLKNFDPIFVPINLFGGQSKDSVKKFDEVFKGPYNILYYPAGLVSRKTKGKIIDNEWKKSIINLSIKYKRDIVPVYIHAKNSNFFYRLANIRKFFGIKANIEMFYLPDEMYKQKGKTYTIVFGEPVSCQTFDKTNNHAYWAQFLKDKVYQLKLLVK